MALTFAELRRSFVVVGPLLLLGACVTGKGTPGAPRLFAATILSAAGMPPKNPDFHAEPAKISDTLEFKAITAGAEHTCAIAIDGDTYCWGSNQYRQLGAASPDETCGDGKLACSSNPKRLENAPRFASLAASIWGTCGLDLSGRAHCWGFGLGGPRADGLLPSSGVPIPVAGDHEFAVLASSPSGNLTCGLTRDGVAWCFSSVDARGGRAQPLTPERVAAGTNLVSIAVGAQHACGIDEARRTFCWGSNQFGQLGAGPSALDGGVLESSAPVAVRADSTFDRIAAGPGHSCALDAGPSLYCWGLGFAGSQSPLAPDRRSIPHGAVPVRVETPRSSWAALGAGTTETCMLSVDGALHCLSTTPTRDGAAPHWKRVESDEPFVSFAAGGQHVCALDATGFAYCWGSSHAGQAGRPAARRGKSS